MNAKATVILDKQYYSECYSDWLRNVSKWRRYQIFIGLILVVIATILFGLTAIHRFIPVILAGIGIIEISSYLLNRHKWMSERLGDKRVGHTVILEFSEDRIIHSGPFSRGEFFWDGIESITPTSSGIFIRPQKGISIYIPDQSWDRCDAKQFVIDRFTLQVEHGVEKIVSGSKS